MKILINGSEDTQPVTGDTLGDILQQVLNREVMQGNYISKLTVNGQAMDPDVGETREIPAAKVDTLDMEVSDIRQLINKNITNAEDYLCKLTVGMQKASDLFHQGNLVEANEFFKNIIDGIEWFSQVIGAVVEARKEDAVDIDLQGQSLQERINCQLDLTSQMFEAHKNKDWVLLADVLEYEMLPFYKDWLDLLPELKQALPDDTN